MKLQRNYLNSLNPKKAQKRLATQEYHNHPYSATVWARPKAPDTSLSSAQKHSPYACTAYIFSLVRLISEPFDQAQKRLCQF
jgi:hypothetical protein